TWLESLRFEDSRSPNPGEIRHGNGTMLWIAEPAELSDGGFAMQGLYSVANQFGLQPLFGKASSGTMSLPRRVIAYPIALHDPTVYVFVADRKEDCEIHVSDRETGLPLTFVLPAQRAALALIGKKEKAVIAKYGF